MLIVDSLVKPVLRKFQRFSTSERYRMLGSLRNRDCILHSGVGTVVLIRSAQTFYERIIVNHRITPFTPAEFLASSVQFEGDLNVGG